jgi:hypothetical protein
MCLRIVRGPTRKPSSLALLRFFFISENQLNGFSIESPSRFKFPVLEALWAPRSARQFSGRVCMWHHLNRFRARNGFAWRRPTSLSERLIFIVRESEHNNGFYVELLFLILIWISAASSFDRNFHSASNNPKTTSMSEWESSRGGNQTRRHERIFSIAQFLRPSDLPFIVCFVVPDNHQSSYK